MIPPFGPKRVYDNSMKNEKTMTLEEFTAVYEALQDEGREKEAALLAGWEDELYLRYWVEVCGEEVEDFD